MNEFVSKKMKWQYFSALIRKLQNPIMIIINSQNEWMYRERREKYHKNWLEIRESAHEQMLQIKYRNFSNEKVKTSW